MESMRKVFLTVLLEDIEIEAALSIYKSGVNVARFHIG